MGGLILTLVKSLVASFDINFNEKRYFIIKNYRTTKPFYIKYDIKSKGWDPDYLKRYKKDIGVEPVEIDTKTRKLMEKTLETVADTNKDFLNQLFFLDGMLGAFSAWDESSRIKLEFAKNNCRRLLSAVEGVKKATKELEEEIKRGYDLKVICWSSLNDVEQEEDFYLTEEDFKEIDEEIKKAEEGNKRDV